MRPMSLDEIRRAVHGRWLTEGRYVTIGGVSTDTRTASAGDLFVALKGKRFDGHAFLGSAADAGCIAAIVRRDSEPPPGVARLFGGGMIGVADTTKALGELGAYQRRHTPVTVVAVTGSNGKTTVKRMIHHILSRRMKGSCSPRSFNNDIGVPLTLLDMEPCDDYVVCEVGSNAPGEVAVLAGIIRPNIAVITSVAATHLEKLGSVDRVAVEKASILGGLTDNSIAVVWGDSKLLDRAMRAYDSRLVRFGVSDDVDLRLTGYERVNRSARFQINGRLWAELPIPGRHNAMNALAAIAVAQRFGFEQDEAAAALKDFKGESMRLEWMDCGAVTVINDAYNANPASLQAAVKVLAEADTSGGRKVLIAGDMHELGPDAQKLHLAAGRDVAKEAIDLLIGVGELGQYIAMGASDTDASTKTFQSVEDLCKNIHHLLQAGDTVLIKGSRAAAMERLIEPFRQAFPGRDDKLQGKYEGSLG